MTAIVINLLAIAYGAILNFVYQGENASILFAYVEGLLVGFLVTVIYCIMTFALGYCFVEEDIQDIHAGRIITLMNTTAIMLTWCGISALIGNVGWIELDYAWMHIVNVLFSGLVVGKANYDASKLRKTLKEKQASNNNC